MWGVILKEQVIDIIVKAMDRLSVRPKLILLALIFSGFLGASILSFSPLALLNRPDAMRLHDSLVAEKQAALLNELVDRKIKVLKIDELRGRVDKVDRQQVVLLERFIEDAFDHVRRGGSVDNLRRNTLITGCQRADEFSPQIRRMCLELLDVLLVLPKH